MGVLASVNKSAKGYAPIIDDENVISISLGSVVNDYVDVKLTGIPTSEGETCLVFCVYVEIDGKMYYLDNGITSENVVGVSYNFISSK